MKKFIYRTIYFQRLVAEKQNSDIWQDAEDIKEETYQEIKKLLYCVGGVAVFILIYLFTYTEKDMLLTDGSIEKQQTQTQQTLFYKAEDGAIQGTTKITIPEKPYSEQEAQQLFKEAQQIIEEEVSGENQSLEQVSQDLNFMEEIEDSPVEIEWSTDKEHLISSAGEVHGTLDSKEGEIVTVTARLSLGEYAQEYSFPVCVVMPEVKDKLWWQRAVQRKLETVIEQTKEEKEIKLPDKIEGEKIDFQGIKKKRPWYYLLAIPVITVALFYGTQQEAQKKKVKRNKGLLRDYPEILSRFSLYIQAGMTSKNALGKLVSEYETQREDDKEKGKKKATMKVRYGYEELRRTYYEMKSGISEHEAYKNMGERIGLSEYKQFSTLMIQQLEKGSRGFLHMLQQETGEAFQQQKRLAKEAGEETGTKLLLPMGILFVITLVLIIIPPCLSFIF